MSMDVPARCQVPHESCSLGVTQATPERLCDRAKRIDDRSPVAALLLTDGHLRPHAPEQTASGFASSPRRSQCADEVSPAMPDAGKEKVRGARW